MSDSKKPEKPKSTETKSWKKGVITDQGSEAVTEDSEGNKHRSVGGTKEEAEEKSQRGLSNQERKEVDRED